VKPCRTIINKNLKQTVYVSLDDEDDEIMSVKSPRLSIMSESTHNNHQFDNSN
jgi:phage major head subunit gpT-like protein